jgi:puromycin-sensitive aminopeptidase
VLPQRVDLHVALDPERGRAFRGEVATTLELARAVASVELHAVGLRVTGAVLEAGGERVRGRVVAHPDRETVEVRLPRRVGPGAVRLELRFAGRLRTDLRGLYFARSGKRRYAFTQLEATDARSFFPCFDEPALKARFRIAVNTRASHTVLSNSPIEKTEKQAGGRKTVRFAETPPLSTYLLALAVGELEASRAVRCGRTPIRVWHVPGKKALTGFALEAARETLARLERYFALPYPYAKLDLVAVPDFEAGAMENAGAVFFRETLLLVDPKTVTRNERKRVAEVVCHELAHMWYGDLVTMAWWDDLWLNEAFATWMAFHVVDDWQPGWRMWNDFQHFRAAALELDALENTHPIYAEVRSPADATENFDLITYEKGASVVRMLERFLGERAFRDGVRRYVRRHREANATAADLWRALEEASGREVESVARAWIEQPGLPLVEVARARGRGRTEFAVRQSRFHGAPRAKGAARRRAGGGRWPIPLVLRVGVPQARRTSLVRTLVMRASERVALGRGEPRFVYANADEGGFLRPLHEPAELRRIAAHLHELSAVERMGLLGHELALLRAGRARIEEYLELAGSLGRETDHDVLFTLAAPLGFLDQQVAPAAGGDTRERLRAWIVARFAPALEELGLAPRRGGSEDVSLRRAALFSILGAAAEWPPLLAHAAERCDAYLRDRRAVDPNLADAVVSLGARRGDARLFASLLRAMERAPTPQERRRFLFGLGEVRDAACIGRALELGLDERVATQDVALLLARMLGNPAARERAWEFIETRWAKLRRRLPPALVTRVIEATPALQTPAYRRRVATFFRKHPVPTGRRALLQALERFDRNAELRRRAAPGLRRWLSKQLGD